MNNCNTDSHVGPLSLSLITEGGASPGVCYPHKMSDPGIHAIEGPAFVISHSARNVVGGAPPLVSLVLHHTWCPVTGTCDNQPPRCAYYN